MELVWDPWGELERRPHLTLVWRLLPEPTGGAAIVRLGGSAVVYLDPRLGAEDRRAALAPSLCMTSVAASRRWAPVPGARWLRLRSDVSTTRLPVGSCRSTRCLRRRSRRRTSATPSRPLSWLPIVRCPCTSPSRRVRYCTAAYTSRTAARSADPVVGRGWWRRRPLAPVREPDADEHRAGDHGRQEQQRHDDDE